MNYEKMLLQMPEIKQTSDLFIYFNKRRINNQLRQSADQGKVCRTHKSVIRTADLVHSDKRSLHPNCKFSAPFYFKLV